MNETVRLKYDDAGFSLEGRQAGKIEIAAQVSQVELDAVEVVWLRDFLDEWLMLNHPDPAAAMCGKLFPASITVDSEAQP